jgi:hypothetical protein
MIGSFISFNHKMEDIDQRLRMQLRLLLAGVTYIHKKVSHEYVPLIYRQAEL